MPLMIDWLTCEVPFFHTSDQAFFEGIVSRVTKDGQVVYQTRTYEGVEGSYDSRVSVRSISFTSGELPGTIHISGNPVKFFQGHNIWGTDDICGIITAFIRELSVIYGIPQPEGLYRCLSEGNFTISRIDINGMYDFGTQLDANQFLSDVQACARTRAGTAVSKGETVYLNKTSKRWGVKLYNKLEEVESSRNKKHQKRELPKNVRDWLVGKARIELTLKSNELREKSLHQAKEWNRERVANVFAEYVRRIEMREQSVRDDLESVLTPTFLATYLMWKDGKDIKSMFKRDKFYRHRRELLKHGVDISVPAPPKPKTAKIIPIQRVITCKPAEIPEWAIGTDWFFEPGKPQLKAVK